MKKLIHDHKLFEYFWDWLQYNSPIKTMTQSVEMQNAYRMHWDNLVSTTYSKDDTMILSDIRAVLTSQSIEKYSGSEQVKINGMRKAPHPIKQWNR